MENVTISQHEYQELTSKAMRYDYLKSVVVEDTFVTPTSRSSKEVIKDFEATKKYTPEFIASLKKGLKRSDYFTA